MLLNKIYKIKQKQVIIVTFFPISVLFKNEYFTAVNNSKDATGVTELNLIKKNFLELNKEKKCDNSHFLYSLSYLDHFTSQLNKFVNKNIVIMSRLSLIT